MFSCQVLRTPTIAVLSTGDELVEPTTECLNRGQVLYFRNTCEKLTKVHLAFFTMLSAFYKNLFNVVYGFCYMSSLPNIVCFVE